MPHACKEQSTYRNYCGPINRVEKLIKNVTHANRLAHQKTLVNLPIIRKTGGMTMDETLYAGIAVGGPLDGKEVEGRFPGGILLVDKPSNRAWVYDYYADQGKFYVRPVGFDAVWDEMSLEQKGHVINETVLSGIDPTRELDYDMRMRAAESGNTEVRALPEEGGN
jgi:hypothetical protein